MSKKPVAKKPKGKKAADKENDAPVIKSRNEAFVDRVATRICHEVPSAHNPYIAESCQYHGYDSLELAEKRSFSDMIFLLQRGELPTAPQSQLFETLLVALCNPGPRHPATRAAMNAGVGKTNPAHILPIAQSVMSGDHLGGGEVTAAMSFLRENRKKAPEQLALELLAQKQRPDEGSKEGDWHIAPGFGSRFGGIDIIPQRIAALLMTLPGKGPSLEWATDFVTPLQEHNLGWLSTGLAAAVFVDLGFHPRAGAGLFQLTTAPGLLAHGLELANKPRTALPFPDDEHYFYEPEKHEQ